MTPAPTPTRHGLREPMSTAPAAAPTPSHAPTAHPADDHPPASDHAHLAHAIEHAAHLLPAQGPITVFIHHNTLHAFEGLRFEQGVEHGGEVFGCQPYLSEDRYRDALSKGRIRFS